MYFIPRIPDPKANKRSDSRLPSSHGAKTDYSPVIKFSFMGANEKESTRSSNSYHEQLIQLVFSQDFLCYERYIHKFLLLHWLHLLKSKHFFLQKFLLQIS